jgi:hypothetical protein
LAGAVVDDVDDVVDGEDLAVGESVQTARICIANIFNRPMFLFEVFMKFGTQC